MNKEIKLNALTLIDRYKTLTPNFSETFSNTLR